MKKNIFIVTVTMAVTFVFTAAALSLGAAYIAGGYLVDAALRRGSSSDASAPPAIFRSAFEGGVTRIKEPNRPKYESDEWTMRSFDGLMLCATHFEPKDESHEWAIVIHGYGLSRAYAYNYATAFLRHGFNVLAPDMRASGKSEGDYITMGAREGRDVADWTREIMRRDPEASIALFGVSMGAASVMNAANNNLPPNVKCIIEDSGYSNLKGIFAEELDKLVGLPPFPFLEFIDLICERRAGFSFADASPIHAVANSRLPILFIHSDADALVPYRMMQELYSASPSSDKEIFRAEGMPHSTAYQKKGYYRQVFEFTYKHMGEK